VTQISDINDPRLVKALAHPIRVRVLGLLEGRTLTPKQIALELGLPLENVSYHVRMLAKFGLIELRHRRMSRGAVEHHYRTKSRPRITAKAWEGLPEIVKEALMGAILQQVVELASDALGKEGFSRPDSHLSRRPVVVDEEGFAEVSRIVSRALDEISEVEKEAAKRLRSDGHEGVPAVVVAMLFEGSTASIDQPAPSAAKPRRRAAEQTRRPTR
jgi:DNA-binding transcriptional ArsR family regulator